MTRKPLEIARSARAGLLRTLAATLALAAVLGLGGCNTFSTYPPVETTGDMTDPANEPLPTLMTEAIRFAHEHYGDGDPDFAINLPEGVAPETYGRVLRKLGAGHPLTDPAEEAYHVLEIRVRGSEAEVDLVYPRRGSIYEMITIKFRNKLVEGWTVLSSRLWRIEVDVPPPHYAAPAERDMSEPAVEPEPPAADDDAATPTDETPDDG